MEGLIATIVLWYGVSLLVSFLIAAAANVYWGRDGLMVFFWGAVLGPLAAIIATALLPEREGFQEGLMEKERPKRRSKAHQRKLEEAAKRSGLR